jgi:hypothetical protein
MEIASRMLRETARVIGRTSVRQAVLTVRAKEPMLDHDAYLQPIARSKSMTRRNRLMTVAILGLSLLVSVIAVSARAGVKFNTTATIDAANHSAYGGVAATRNSSDTIQQIGCSVTVASTFSATCFARDAANNFATCVTYDQNMISAAMSAQGDSFINFRWDDSGNCNFLNIYNDSMEMPKSP